MSEGGSEYLLSTCCGEEINLRTYQEGVETQKIDLLPYIRINLPGFPSVWFDKEAEGRGFKFSDKEDAPGDAQNDTTIADFEAYLAATPEEDWEAEAVVDWQAVPVQPLRGDLAQMGDLLSVYSGYVSGAEPVGYGRNETEQGEHDDESIDWEEAEFAEYWEEDAGGQGKGNKADTEDRKIGEDENAEEEEDAQE